MAEIRIGTSGWFYKHWSGRFYPKELRPDGWLSYYAGHFDTVENNSAFYRLPKESMVAGWKARVPEDFRYAVKLSRFISHVRRLKDIAEPLTTFLGRLCLLGEKLAVVLVQLPPSLRCDQGLLSDFLVQLPKKPRFAVEFRHDSWLCPGVYERLARHNCGLCLAHSSRYPVVEERVTADFCYLRFHGPGGLYASNYSDEELAGWAAAIQRLAGRGVDVYAYFNNDFQAYAVENARMLRQMLLG